MKKGMCVLLAALLCLSLAACGTGRESAESVVETAIQAFQSVDEEKIAEYWGDGNTTVSESESPEDAEMTQQMIEAIDKSKDGEVIFTRSKSVLLKNMKIRRIYDEQAQTLLYVAYSTKETSGSFHHSLSAIPLYGTEGYIKPLPKVE